MEESFDKDQEDKPIITFPVKKLNLRHAVITSVDRDDLHDGGANHFYDVITETRKLNPTTTIEVLTPDFLRGLWGINSVNHLMTLKLLHIK